jgi:hypothetical protein
VYYVLKFVLLIKWNIGIRVIMLPCHGSETGSTPVCSANENGITPINVIENQSVFLIAGWSDKVFDILSAIEDGSNAVGVIEGMVV